METKEVFSLKADSFKKVFFFSTHLPIFLTDSTVCQKKMEDELKKNTFLKESPFIKYDDKPFHGSALRDFY